MKNLTFSLIDNDFAVNAKTNLSINNDEGFAFTKFLREVEDGLVTVETAFLEVEGIHNNPVTFTISLSE